MQIDERQLLLILPNARPVAGVFLPALNRAMAHFKIDSPVRAAAFLAQIGHESGQLLRLSESLNYSAARLAVVWPTRFRGAGGVPNARALALAGRPQAIANAVYANRNGNGDEASGDGWRYRGRGLIHVTGRGNYRDCGAGIGQNLEDYPELLEQPEFAALSAAWYWKRNGLNELADAGRFATITQRINGGTTGEAERLALWLTGREVLA